MIFELDALRGKLKGESFKARIMDETTSKVEEEHWSEPTIKCSTHHDERVLRLTIKEERIILQRNQIKDLIRNLYDVYVDMEDTD